MRPLFFRILGLLIASFIVVLLIAFTLFRWSNHEFESDTERSRAMAQVVSARLVDSYLEGDPHRMMRRIKKHRGARAWVLDSENHPVFGSPPPPGLLSKIDSYPAVVAPAAGDQPPRYLFASLVIRDKTPYRVVIEAPSAEFHRIQAGLPREIRSLILILSLGIASVLLSYWILRPLKQFVSTTKSISGDNLNTRIPQTITRRRDMFGDLGREFNEMTGRVASSLESQRQLLRDVSHELRSPLARIQVASSLLNQKLGDRDELSRIDAEVERLDSLIERLLTLSRLQNNHSLAQTRFDLSQLVRELIDNANFEFKNQRKQIDLAGISARLIQADRELLSSALENIIRNSLRFTEGDQPVTVTLDQKEQQQTSGTIIRVCDHGPGVADEELPRLFEPFYRADNSRSIDHGHHGIGLALAKTVIHLHQGSIRAFNLPTGGLCVEIWIPESFMSVGAL